jgi:ribose-phosphate pyrophosphokinase
MKRYSEILKIPVPYFFGNKKRNLNTGDIIGYELIDCPNIKDKAVLIIDDLCAFGGTFLGASEKLKENGASNVMLYISHCENSIYKGKLLNTDLVSRIFTTNSVLTDWSSNKIINVESLGE